MESSKLEQLMKIFLIWKNGDNLLKIQTLSLEEIPVVGVESLTPCIEIYRAYIFHRQIAGKNAMFFL